MTKILMAVGSGLEVNAPAGVIVLPISVPVEAGQTIGPLQQQEMVKAALAKPVAGPSLAEMAKGHRRVAILAGDLSLPAPYSIALPMVIAALVEAEIRPSRIAVLTCPGDSGPVLGRGAIHRYGEEIVGDHEVNGWQPGGENQDQLDAVYVASDLKISVGPGRLPAEYTADFAVALELGRKPRIDIVSVRAGATRDVWRVTGDAERPAEAALPAEVFLTSGGGSDWESTFEEAVLSLWWTDPSPYPLPQGEGKKGQTAAASAVLAFSGAEGLGSARFTRDFWALLEQAEEYVAGGGALAGSTPRPERFDAAATLAYALSSYSHLVLFSREFSEHAEGEEFTERLAALPNISQRLGLVGREVDVWALLERWHGESYRLLARPLGWRGA